MRILVTAGPTREYLDSVRFLSNASSGRMGYAIASEAGRRGHQVVLVSGPVGLRSPSSVAFFPVSSAKEMLEACVSHFSECHAAIMTAAVSDYRPVIRGERKMAKTDGPLRIELEPTVDICAHLGAIKGDRIVIGFALEDHDHREHAQEKLRRKHCDAIVLNDLRTVSAKTAEIEVLHDKGGWSGPFSGTKRRIADRVVDLVEHLCQNRAK